jgi:hypothetical protein
VLGADTFAAGRYADRRRRSRAVGGDLSLDICRPSDQRHEIGYTFGVNTPICALIVLEHLGEAVACLAQRIIGQVRVSGGGLRLRVS